jgi:flagellar assembly protein FliH
MSSLPELMTFELAGNAALPADLIEHARASAAAVGYAHGWAQGVREARLATTAEESAARSEMAEHIVGQRAELAALLITVAETVQAVQRQAEQAAELGDDTVLKAALRIAQALLGAELSDPDGATRAAVRRALRSIPTAEPVTIAINADVCEQMNNGPLADLLMTEAAPCSVTFIPDANLAIGDAIARSGVMTADARLTQAVRRVRECIEGDQ